MDAADRKILNILQRDATVTVAEIGRAVGLSSTPCWKRIQKLQAQGVIRKRVALLARDKIGIGVTVQVFVQTGDHAPEAVDAFIETVRDMPEVVEFHRLAGDCVFALRVVAADIGHYDAIYQRLTASLPLRQVTSYFELAQLKSETALPLSVAAQAGSNRQPARLTPLSRNESPKTCGRRDGQSWERAARRRRNALAGRPAPGLRSPRT